MKKLRRTTKQYILVIMACIILIGGGFAVAYFTSVNQIRSTYETKLNTVELEIATNKKGVYVATKKIGMGDKISKENVAYGEKLSSMPSDYFITEEDMGKLAVINIDKDTILMKNMITTEQVDGSLREREFTELFLSSNLKENDFVDIRILFPNGEDCSVLPKKALKNLSLEENKNYMWLTPEENLTISCAIVDAFQHKGSKLYTVKYIEPLLQEPTEVTYTPSEAVINLIQKDPNILEVASKALSEVSRKNLENRLAKYKEEYGESTIAWNSNSSGDNYINEGSSAEDTTQSEETVDEEYYSTNEEDEFTYVD